MFRARTIQPDGNRENFDGKVFEKTLVKASGLKFLAKMFSLPDVKPGCIIEYKYRTQRDTQYVWSINWTVQEDYFTRIGGFRSFRTLISGCRHSTTGCSA